MTQRKTTNDHFVVLDSGRSIVKGKTQSCESEFIHAITQLTDTEYRQAVARDFSDEIMVINGVPFAMGNTAIRRGYQSRQTTAERYNEIYYGSLLAAMLFRLYDKPIKNILLYASHPPTAVEYRPEIIAAAKGKWLVECMGEKREYVVSDVRCFDEPIGGVMNLLISGDGKNYHRSDIKEGSTLVMDIGGQTIDIAALDNGRVDYTSIESVDGGIIEVETRFGKLLRAEHRHKLSSANYLKPENIRNALQTGVYDAGAFGILNVGTQVKEATDDIILRIKDLIDQFGGLPNYNNIVLTGGGGGLLYNRINDYFNHAAIRAELGRDYFHLADNSQSVHMANVRGGFKLLKMFQKAGKI